LDISIGRLNCDNYVTKGVCGIMEKKPDITFSIVVTALNPGRKLVKTVESILMQQYNQIEIIVKDGMSADGSIEELAGKYGEDRRIRIFREPDSSIYNGMNQAILKCTGEYILFLNCGDTFCQPDILSRTADVIRKDRVVSNHLTIYYGNTHSGQTNTVIYAPPVISGFTCYRNIPCHQSCFYDSRLFAERQSTEFFREEYRIRADYEHFLWSYYRKSAKMVYLDMTVAEYEGGGYSESRENRRRDKEEHQMITRELMGKWERRAYQLVMILTLAPLRRWIANNKALSGVYEKLKSIVYRRKG